VTELAAEETDWPPELWLQTAPEAATSNNNAETRLPEISDLPVPVPQEAPQPAVTPVPDGTGEPAEPAGHRADRILAWFRRLFRGVSGAVSSGPAAWPLFSRRCPSVAEVWRRGREFETKTGHRPWDNPAIVIRLPYRAAVIADAVWETFCMTLRVWFRTRITWAVTIVVIVALIIGRH
jgi:hypothetical protein